VSGERLSRRPRGPDGGGLWHVLRVGESRAARADLANAQRHSFAPLLNGGWGGGAAQLVLWRRTALLSFRLDRLGLSRSNLDRR
jgi:hypothetical protein